MAPSESPREPPLGLSLAKFAKIAGVSPEATIDPEDGLRQWREVSPASTRPRGNRPGSTTPTTPEGASSRERKAELEANLLQLEYDRKRGELVSASEVEAHAFEMGRRLREFMLSFAGRLSPALEGLDAADRHRAIEREMNQACDDLADGKLDERGAG